MGEEGLGEPSPDAYVCVCVNVRVVSREVCVCVNVRVVSREECVCVRVNVSVVSREEGGVCVWV